MLKERARIIAVFVLLADLVIVAAAFVLAHWTRSDLLPGMGLADSGLYPLDNYLPLLPLALLIWAVLLLRSGTYRSHRTVPLLQEVLDLARVCVLAGVALALAIYFFRLDEALLRDDLISRWWISLLVLLAFVGLVMEKVTLRLAARYSRVRGLNYRTLLFVGTSDAALAMADSVERHRYWGYKILGFLTEGESARGATVGGYPVLGTLDDLDALVETNAVDEVIFGCERPNPERDEKMLRSLQELGICVRFVLSPFPEAVGGPVLGELDGVPLMTYSRAPTGQPQLFLKRGIDVVVSLVLLLLLLPLMVVIGLAIKLTSRGPVLFRQTRCGLNGRRFTMLKFRTMVEGAENDKRELSHLNEMGGPVFKIRGDPRVTPFGALLRKFSLDELPQLWNVLRGEMSLVGPRPALPDEVEQYERWQKRRLSMRPGLTCLWQVSGRNELDFDRWMELDLKYVDSWSPLLDAKILMRTIPVVLSGRGAS